VNPYRRGAVWWIEFDRRHLGQRVFFRHSCATRNAQKAAAMARMLTRLAEDHRWDLLAMLAEGEYRVPDVFAYHEAGRLHEIRTSKELVRVDAAVAAFAAEADSDHTAAGRRHFGRAIARLNADAKLRDLPALLGRLKARMTHTPRGFNYLLMTGRALARATCGEDSATYQELRAIKRFRYRAKPVHPFTRAELREIMDWMGPVRGRMLWTLCLTGMRPGEYFRADGWEVDGHIIRIHGTKTKGSERIVPVIEEPVKPECSYNAFRQHLAKYPGGRVRVYRSRHTYAHWLERSRVPRTMRRLLMGHSSRDISDDYEWAEISRFMRAIAARFRKFLGKDRVAIKRETA
jgi:integrase